jgi:hypothetical protein
VNERLLNYLGLALVAVIGIAFMVLTPRFAELDAVLELTVYMVMAILALSLALIWGYGGILCFGQSAFFGLGAYTYAIAMFNIGESTIPLLLAIILPAAFAALLGYFMFYGRISDVQLGQLHRRSRIPYRHGAARRLQRHSRHPAAELARQQDGGDRSRRHVLSCNRIAARHLFRPAAVAGKPVRPHHGRHPRERTPCRIVGL